MTDRLASAKFMILRQIFTLAREQRESLKQEHLGRFMEILDLRDDLIGQLQRLVEDAAELPENVIAFPTAIDQSEEDAMALDTVIRGILDHDRENETLLREKMLTVKQQLPELRANRAANAAYRVQDTFQSFIDRVS